MELQCGRDEEVFDALAGDWAALHQRSATATPYNSPLYARLWWRHFGMPGTLQVWSVWDAGQLVGVAPLYQTTDEQGAAILRLVGGVEVSDYLDIVTEPGREGEIVAALLVGWADALCCTLDLHALPQASPSREAFLSLAPDAGFVAAQAREALCPVIPLPATWEGYLEQLEGKQRRELRRKLRKAGQEGLVSWYRVPPAMVAEEMEHFFALHVASSAEKAAFMTPAMRAFFRELAVAFAGEGWLDLCFLLVNGAHAASLLAFRFRGALLLYNSGFDSALDETLSPGWLLLSYHIEDAIAEGLVRYDFLRGDEAYKFRFGARAEAIYQLQLRRSPQPIACES